MRTLGDLIFETIVESPQPKIKMARLRKVARERYPQIDVDERDSLLFHALEELATNQFIRIPARRTPKAWIAGDKLPCWINRSNKVKADIEKHCESSLSGQYSSWTEGLTLKEIRAQAPWVGKMLRIGPSLHLSKVTLNKALIVNEYMRGRSCETTMLPVNERSLQLFGYEKALKNVHKVGLFGGRITLDDLDCYRVPEPLQGVRWPDKPVNAPILIVENSTTFYSAWKTNNICRMYSAIVFGRGKMIKGVELATDSLEEIREESAKRSKTTKLPDLHYFGDLDPEGVEIPISVSRLREKHGLEPLLPANLLYQRLLSFPDQEPEHDWPKGLFRDELLEWLGEPMASSVLDTFDRNRRWAQEWISRVIFEEIFASSGEH